MRDHLISLDEAEGRPGTSERRAHGLAREEQHANLITIGPAKHLEPANHEATYARKTSIRNSITGGSARAC